MLAQLVSGRLQSSIPTSSSYVPTEQERRIFYALFRNAYALDLSSPLLNPEPIAVEEVAPEPQLDWYDEKGLNELWASMGERQAAFADMGMGDYILELQRIDAE